MRLGVKWYLAAGMVAGAVGTILAGMAWASSATPVTDRPVPGIEQRLPPPERENRTEVVSLGGAASARIEVELGAGTLSLGGGSVAGSGAPLGRGQLLRGAFLDAGDPPDVSYRVDDGRVGHLRLTQRETGTGLPRRDQLDAWQLYLNRPSRPTSASPSAPGPAASPSVVSA
jgi:hypothetical protein